MPRYDLKCVKCGAENKIWASIAEKSEGRVSCPDCGANGLETIFKSPPSYVKGASAGIVCPSAASCGSSGCRHAG